MTNFGAELPAQSGFLVAGEWIDDGALVSIRSPYDAREVGVTRLASCKYLENAIASAVQAFAQVRELPSFKRTDTLLKVAEGARSQADTFAPLMVPEACTAAR